MNRVFIFVHGILSNPADSKVWDHRAASWVNRETPWKGDNLPYRCGVIGRAFGQDRRIEHLAGLLTYYAGWQVVLSGHSNGCDVAVNALRESRAVVSELHLFNAATPPDWQANGMNDVMRAGRLGKVACYCAGQDMALAIVHDNPAARWLGYGTLGLSGPTNVAAAVAGRVQTVKDDPWDGFGHSTCWSEANFETSMNLVVGQQEGAPRG